MNPVSRSQAYFYRNRGSWNWKAHFQITDWQKFWKSELPLLRKMMFAAFIFSQRIFGDYDLWTNVDYQEGSAVVGHQTRLKKFGLTFMRSRKQFTLAADGSSLKLTGNEYFWPFLSTAHSFEPLSGTVEESTTRAIYQMPLFGTKCDCQTFLAAPEGEIKIQTPWLKGVFTLTDESKLVLKSRFTA